MANKIQGAARVQVTLEVALGQWGGECSIGQLHDQAGKEAVEKLTYAIQSIGQQGQQVKIIGQPKVIGVITESN